MSDNRIEGAGHKMKGAVKEGLGKLTGDRKMQAEGFAEKTAGKVQNAAGKIQDQMDHEPRHFADHDRAEGAGKKMSGAIKEGVGKLTGNERMQAEGAAEKAAGSVQNAAGKAKDAARDTLRR
jgi:uncharacterized protein YjbJ (UPF0337 family)